MLQNKLAPLTTVLTLTLFSGVACAGDIAAGYLSFDATGASTATFDIVNSTGPNASAFPDTTFPISSVLDFNNVSLLVDFAGGGSVTEDPTQFSSDGAGGFTGLFNFDLTQFSLSSATLSGLFDSGLVQLNDGSGQPISTAFSATVMPSVGSSVQPGDFALITATATPEPGSWLLVIAGCALVPMVRRAKGSRR